MKCSVVIPVYRGERTLDQLVDRLAKSLPKFFDSYEVILVDDGSPDNSWDVIKKITRKHKFAHGIHLMRNYGQHNATLCGIRAARFELTVTMDQDLQHPPEDIPILLAKLNEGFDVVYGSPKVLPQGFVRNLLTSNIKFILSKVMGVSSVRNISAFRLFRTELRDAFANFQSPTLIIDVLLSWGTTRFTYVQVDIAPAERSNYNFVSLVMVALSILTGYSTLPLRFASFLGFFLTLFGFGVFVYVFIVYLTLGSLPGFPFLASIISLFSGAQMFTFGIFGEYLARIFDRSMDRPSYIIKEGAGTKRK
jgi:undecaprenyl-phosphate 4-deoxy-4-formamido-L-arabinose transferase